MHQATPSHSGNSVRRLLRLAGLVALAGFTALLSARAAEALKTFDVPAGPAETSLKQFSEQSGRGVIFVTSVVQGVKTAAVKGELAPQAALETMLKDTGLVAVPDEKTGALAIKRNPVPNAPRAAQTDSARPEKVEDGKLVLEKYQVTGQKIDGLNNKGLLQAGENAALYHDVFTRVDIERLGISSLEELFRLIPQTSSASTPLQVPASNTAMTGGLSNKASTVGLRGFSSSQTVVLVNGRAMPRSSLFSDGGADIARIPLAAIERVEVLPYAGSAIYGAGAIGGAINIILRKDYHGRDLTTYVGTSTEGGATEYRMTYLEGRSFNGGKTNLTWSLSYQHRDALRAEERGYLDEALRRYGPNSTAVDAEGRRIYESLIMSAFAGAPATIQITNPPSAAVNDLGVPGAPGARYVAIPAGTTVAGSLALTPASFTATAGQANQSPRFGRSILYEPIDSYSLNAQLEHVFVKDKLEAYGEFTLGYNRKNYTMPQRLVVNLTATDPLNPFRTDVTPGFVGREVRVLLDTPDLPDARTIYEDESARAVLGLKGHLTETWEWSVDGVVDYAHSTVTSTNPITDLLELVSFSPYANPGPAAPAATRRAVYALFADHDRYPISDADIEKYFGSTRYSATHGVQWEGNARLMGEVFNLPAGPVKASTVGKYQKWDFVYGDHYTGSDATSLLVHNVPLNADLSGTPATREVWQGALEISVPVISDQWRPLPIKSLELQGSLSSERSVSSSINEQDLPFTFRKSASSGVIATKAQLTPDIALRASYSEGFYPPDWSAVGQPQTSFTIPGFFADPKRGNTMQFTPVMSIKQGGNPDLKPETATSENYGLIFTPRFLKNFSLTVDYWKIEKVDAVVYTGFPQIIANPDAYGFLITREAPAATDPAGWLGRITAVDARAFNASVVQTEGFDVKTRYRFDTASIGSFDFTGSASFTNNYNELATPVSPMIDLAGGAGPVRWRGNGSATWSNDQWSATITGRYLGHVSTATTDPSPSYPGASRLDGGRIPAYLHWDLQFSYEVPYRVGSYRDWRTWVGGTKWTLGVLNVLNDTPAFLTDGYAFYSRSDDPRQRYVYVQIKKSL
jgi:outer membrane receptor protein involved in Fe transport